MIASWRATRLRVLGALGGFSMYRLMLLSLILLWLLALAFSFFHQVTPAPADLVLGTAVLLTVTAAVDVLGHLIVRRPVRLESSAITALLLVFILGPTADPASMGGLALAGSTAAASKYVLIWRGRHLFNPAAFGAAVVTTTGLAASMWWVGTPVLAGAVILCGVLLAWRTQRLALVGVFVLVAVIAMGLRYVVMGAVAGLAPDIGGILTSVLWSSPVLFLGFFMLTEPLTLPPRRGQAYVVALVAALVVGIAPTVGTLFASPELALLVANLVAFVLALAARTAPTLILTGRRVAGDALTELTFRSTRPVTWRAGQYLELEVPHRRPDGRGTRREFSIIPAVDPCEIRIVHRDAPLHRGSSFKRALASLPLGSRLHATGVWGEFTLPSDPTTPVVLVGAGVGATPLLAQLAEPAAASRDVRVILVASTLAAIPLVSEFVATGAAVTLVSPERPDPLPRGWSWGGGQRLDAAVLSRLVPDLAHRDVYLSGPPSLVAALSAATLGARRVHTDAFAGY